MTVVLTGVLGPFAQQTVQPPQAAPSLPPSRDLPFGRGLLAARHFKPPSDPERLPPVRSIETHVAHDPFMLELNPFFAGELEVAAQPRVEGLARELRQSPSTLTEQRAVVHIRLGSPGFEPDVQPFVIAVRRLLESEQLAAARQRLSAAPADILSDPLVVRLRSVLAPPVVKEVDRRDADRRQEYEWLRTEGPRYRGCWVALDGNRLLGSAPTLRELQQTLKTMTLIRRPLLHRVD